MIARQLFGRTGHQSSRAIFGAAALSAVTQKEADEVLDVLLGYGVNHIDVAASYGDAELRVAPWLRRYPHQFFVATKTDGRTYDDAKRDIHRSLKRLGLEQVDLIQLHNLVDPIDWDTALMAPPERDLWMLETGDGDATDAYTAATGTAIIPAMLDLFRIRWDLSDRPRP